MTNNTKKTRKQYSAKDKFAAVYESYATGDLGATASRYGIHINMLNKWRYQFKQNGAEVFERGVSRRQTEDKKIAQLEHIIGRQAIQIELLKKTEELLH